MYSRWDTRWGGLALTTEKIRSGRRISPDTGVDLGGVSGTGEDGGGGSGGVGTGGNASEGEARGLVDVVVSSSSFGICRPGIDSDGDLILLCECVSAEGLC